MRRVHSVRDLVMTRQRQNCSQRPGAKAGREWETLDEAFNLLVAPIGQSQPELPDRGAGGEADTEVSGKGRKLINAWKVWRKHTSTHIIPTLPIKQWVSEKCRIQLTWQVVDPTNMTSGWPKIWTYVCLRLENPFFISLTACCFITFGV